MSEIAACALPDATQSKVTPVDPLPADMSHNTYSQFVTRHDDLIGLIAYTLYKQQKIDFLTRHYQENGVRPTLAEVNIFCGTFRNPAQVEMLRGRAGMLLEGMTEEVLNRREEGIADRYERELDQRLKQGPGFWKGVMTGVVGNFAFAASVALLLFVISAADKGVIPALAAAAGYEPKSSKPSTTTPDVAQPSVSQ